MKFRRPQIPAEWKRPLSARVERTGLLAVLFLLVVRQGVTWLLGGSPTLIAISLELAVIGIAVIAIGAEIVRQVRQRRESRLESS